ncbi:unnamed protein product, partial [Prorocentrum cordatum]
GRGAGRRRGAGWPAAVVALAAAGGCSRGTGGPPAFVALPPASGSHAGRRGCIAAVAAGAVASARLGEAFGAEGPLTCNEECISNCLLASPGQRSVCADACEDECLPGRAVASTAGDKDGARVAGASEKEWNEKFAENLVEDWANKFILYGSDDGSGRFQANRFNQDKKPLFDFRGTLSR